MIHDCVADAYHSESLKASILQYKNIFWGDFHRVNQNKYNSIKSVKPSILNH